MPRHTIVCLYRELPRLKTASPKDSGFSPAGGTYPHCLHTHSFYRAVALPEYSLSSCRKSEGKSLPADDCNVSWMLLPSFITFPVWVPCKLFYPLRRLFFLSPEAVSPSRMKSMTEYQELFMYSRNNHGVVSFFHRPMSLYISVRPMLVLLARIPFHR
jgi:hypothetical protein